MGQSLASLAPYLISANVRKRFDPAGLNVGSGLGQPGDLVLGDVIPKTGEAVVVYDQDIVAHRVAAPRRVIATLGTRESTTHVNGGLPDQGLQVHEGADAHWLAGESGLVGLLQFESTPNRSVDVETSVRFRCTGLLQYADGRNVNIEHFALEPRCDYLSTPILCIGATAAEMGKTVLTGKIIRHLVSRGIRVAAIKVTGTGGTKDSQEHLAAGASFTLDQVDAGLITTYTDPAVFERCIVRSFRAAQDRRPDIIVAELGGDLIWANNPRFLNMAEMRDNIRLLAVLTSEALSCVGISQYLDQSLKFPMSRVRLFSSPFRNYFGMAKRLAMLGASRLYDSNDMAHIRSVVDEAVS